MNWYFLAFKKWKDFSGRSNRKEFFYFFLFDILVIYLPIIFWGTNFADSVGKDILRTVVGAVWIIYCFLSIPVSWSVSVRRLLDYGKSGAWILLCFVPVINIFFFLFNAAKEGDLGSNFYGEPYSYK